MNRRPNPASLKERGFCFPGKIMTKMILLAAVPVLFCSSLLFAEMKTFIRECTYQVSDLDSKASCRTIAMEQVKRDLLEEFGTYVKSKTTVTNSQLADDEIVTLTAGVVQTKLLEERWDGKEYWLKAELKADPEEVASSIEKVKNDQKLVHELEESRAEAAQAMEEVQSLKQQLAQASADREKQEQYDEAVGRLNAAGWFEKGSALNLAGEYEGAAKAYDQAVLLRPDDPKAYAGRAVVYVRLGDYRRAADDLEKAAALDPGNATSYFERAKRAGTLRRGSAAVNDKRAFLAPGTRKSFSGNNDREDRVRMLKEEKKTEPRAVFRDSERKISTAGDRDQLRKERELSRKKRVEEIQKKKKGSRQREKVRMKEEPRQEENRR